MTLFAARMGPVYPAKHTHTHLYAWIQGEVPGAFRLLPVTGHIALLGQTGGQCPLVCQPLLQPMIKGCRSAKPRPPAPTPAVGDEFVSMCICVSH